MPFKSAAQRRKFAQLLVEGKITPEVYEEWNRETGSAHLPERVGEKKHAKKKAAGGSRKRAGATTGRRTKARSASTSKSRSGSTSRSRSSIPQVDLDRGARP
jgi:hypothetical protein